MSHNGMESAGLTSRTALLILAALTLALPGCSSTPEPSPTLTSPSPSITPSPSPSPSETVPVVLQGAPNGEVTSRLVPVDQLTLPWDIAWTPDGSMLVTLSDEGRILRYRDGEIDYLRGAGADWLVANVDPTGEGGLLGIAIMPSNPNWVYVYITRGDGNAVVRMALFGQTLGAPTDVVTGITKNSYHDAGRIRFGPDGFLYIATGDAGDKPLSQDLNSINGKILRVVANGTAEDGSPAPGNPFGTLIWSYGHRNVEGLGWAADGRMFASELGQNTWDELNLIEPGKNYGWPIKEGLVGAPDGTALGSTVDGFTYPLAQWATSEMSPSGIAVTEEAIYIGALRGQRVWRVPLTPDGIGTPHVLLNDLGRIRLVAQRPGGNLFLLTSNGSGTDKVVEFTVHQIRG
jgi:glucose/arabinose dehydrogenase